MRKAGQPTRLGKRALRLWAVILAGTFVHLAVRAVGPLARVWSVADVGRAGQLTVYNEAPLGGNFGLPVEIGDWDGDGKTDLALAPMQATSGPADAPRPNGGVVHIYQGNARLEGIIDAGGEAPPSVTLWGAREEDLLGVELFTADVNGDGIEDLIVGSQNYDGRAGDCVNCGAVHVIPGRPELFAGGGRIIDLAAPPDDIISFYGSEKGGRLGIWVEAGDLDGDGLADLLMGSDQTPADGPDAHRGMVLVVYGRDRFPPVVDLATDAGRDLPDVSRVYGRDREDHFGASIHSRDLNGDGRDELIVGSALERLSAGRFGTEAFPNHSTSIGGDGPTNERTEAGEASVIFGPVGGGRLPAVVDLAAPPPDLEGRVTYIYGTGTIEACAEEITSGDFNGDGFIDLALGAIRGAFPRPQFLFGKAYVIYWQPDLEGVEIDLREVDENGVGPHGVQVATMFGVDEFDILGDTLSAGDFNHDGFDDLAVGIPHADVGGREDAGAVALLFGSESPWPASFEPEADDIPEGLRVAYVVGADDRDLLSYSMEARDYDGDGYADIFPNAMWGDGNDDASPNAGEAYVVSGYSLLDTVLSIESISPAQGRTDESTPVKVLGEGFTTKEDMSVEVDGQSIETFTVVSGRMLELELPTSPLGTSAALTVRTRYGEATLADGFTYLLPFLRGDADLDQRIALPDPIAILSHLFGGSPLRCLDAGDANDDGSLDLTDALRVLNFLFAGGPAPPPPHPEADVDPTVDDLSCRG